MEQPQKRFYNAEELKREPLVPEEKQKTIHSVKTSARLPVVRLLSGTGSGSAFSHATHAFTGLDKASLVCQGVRQEEWEGHFFLFYFKPSFAETRSGRWLPTSSGTRLIGQFREKFASQHSFLTLASAQACVSAHVVPIPHLIPVSMKMTFTNFRGIDAMTSMTAT